ncbi:esterase-like activity of phytase family protein [Afipia sp. TerB]
MTASISRRRVLQGAAAAFGLLAARSAGARDISPVRPAGAPITVNARPIPSFDPRDPSHVRIGSLQYRSGLVLTSPFKRFGGLSGLRIDPAGRNFTMISDKANWFTGRLVYDGTRVAGLADVRTAPMRGSDGNRITARGWYDSESLALDGSIAYVGLERVHQILRFDFSRGGIRALGEPIIIPPAIGSLPFNKGIEALIAVGSGKLAGTLIAISERGLDSEGNILAFLIGGPAPGQFSVTRSNDYDISDAALLPSGDLLVLERKFSILSGVGIRIRRIPLTAIAPGSLVDGPAIFEADLGYEIDNMEGIDCHTAENGDVVVTMVSDDNFSMIQRTLLLQFTLVEE